MKHAYLIIANKNHSQLQKLLTMLDDSRNDIYLMIDKKANNFMHDFHVNFSTLNYLKPMNIYWGSYSLVEAEIKLLEASVPYHYSFYHLLSGSDLPLENQDYIHNFFDMHNGCEFLKYGDPSKIKKDIYFRIKPHSFRKHLRNRNIFMKFYRKIEKKVLLCFPSDKDLRIHVGYASQWFSIDNKLALLIIKNKDWIRSTFYYGDCVDELFIPTLINYHPEFINKIYYKKPFIERLGGFQGNLRFIHFKGYKTPSPCIWTINDYKLLLKAKNRGYLFSRKFDSNVDNQIVNKIFNNVMR